MNKVSYENGSLFLVPLNDGGFCRGVIARANFKGAVFGYFFGPKLCSMDDECMHHGLDSSDAIFRAHFGDLGLLNGEWLLVGNVANWCCEDWPMPPSIDVPNPKGKFGNLIEYDEKTLEMKRIDRIELASVNLNEYVLGGTMGYSYLQNKLSSIFEDLSTANFKNTATM